MDTENWNKSEPLTLDELRAMDGEPVWWWNESRKPVCTICIAKTYISEPYFVNTGMCLRIFGKRGLRGNVQIRVVVVGPEKNVNRSTLSA